MLPEITHLQAYVIQLIARDEHSGRFIRASLEDVGTKTSPAAFYQLMARMEKSGLVSGHYDTSVVDGQTIKERRYHATLAGLAAFLKAVDFYKKSRQTSAISQIVETALTSTAK